MSWLPWTSELPSNWQVVPARAMLEPVRRDPQSNDMTVTAFRDGQVTLRSNRRVDGFTESVKEIGYQGVRRGEVVIHSMDAFAGAIGVSDSDGKMSPVVHIYTAPSDNPEFIVHSLRAASRAGFIRALAKGIRERSTSFDRPVLKSMALPRPPRDTQDAIVAYLDRETQKIDELITEQRSLIETLRERRQAVIDAEFGKLPNPRISLRRYITFLTSGSRGWGDYYADSGNTVVRIGNLPRAGLALGGERKFVALPPEVTEGKRTVLRSGDLLFSITAYIGSVAVVSEEWIGAYVSQHVALCRLEDEVLNTVFIGYFALSTDGNHQLSEGAVGGTKVQLALDDIKALRVPLVPLEIQGRIVSNLDEQTSRIDELISESEDLIKLSQERRAALITAAVTGQIDVRRPS